MQVCPGVPGVVRAGPGRLQLAAGGPLPVPGGHRGRRGGEPRQEVRRLPQVTQPQRVPGEQIYFPRLQTLNSNGLEFCLCLSKVDGPM